MSIAIKGLRVKPNYESLINVAVSDKLYNIKFPNRNATFLRNGFVLSQLDGEGMRQMEKQQEMASKESYKEHLLKEIAKNTGSNIHDLRNDNHDDMRKERIERAVNSNVPEQYAMSQDDASMSSRDASMTQKDASISAESFPNRPRSGASRSHTSVKTESSSSSSSPNPPPDSAATADYTDEVQRQTALTHANLTLLIKQEQEKRRIAAEKVKKELEEIESNTLREQRMGQRYTAAKSMPKPMAKARVKKEETKEDDTSRSRSSWTLESVKAESERRPRSAASRSRTSKGSSVKNEIKSVKSETKSEPMSVKPRSDASRSRTSRGTSVKSEKKSVKSEPKSKPRYTAAKTMAKPTATTRVKSEPTSVKLERSRSRDTSVKIEPKAEDTSRPRGRPTTKVKLEDGTENTSRRRGRPAGSKNKPK